MNLPINDLKRHNAPLATKLSAAIERVLARGHYVLGPENESFEQEFSAYLGATGAVAVGNGTDALELSLRALAIGPGDEVITVANAGMYATTAIRAVGAMPCYVEIDPDTLLIDITSFARKLSPSTRAVIVTHLYGRMADIEGVLAVAYDRGIAVIEDCAQAHGARRNGRAAGTWGHLSTFSFYPTKNLGALGDGGLVVSNDPSLLERVRHCRQYGWSKKYECTMPGGRNSRLDELQAAILRAKLQHLDAWNARRREIVRRYRAGLQGIGWLLPTDPGEDDVAHLFVVRPRQREIVRASLTAQGIGCDVHYPIPDHKQPAYASHTAVTLPITEAACRSVLTLPCFPEMTDDEIRRVISSCWQAASKEEKT